MNANHLFIWLQWDRDRTLDRRASRAASRAALFIEAGVIGEEASWRGAPALDVGLLGSILLAVRAAS